MNISNSPTHWIKLQKYEKMKMMKIGFCYCVRWPDKKTLSRSLFCFGIPPRHWFFLITKKICLPPTDWQQPGILGVKYWHSRWWPTQICFFEVLTTNLEEDSPMLTRIFFMGWNHQREAAIFPCRDRLLRPYYNVHWQACHRHKGAVLRVFWVDFGAFEGV